MSHTNLKRSSAQLIACYKRLLMKWTNPLSPFLFRPTSRPAWTLQSVAVVAVDDSLVSVFAGLTAATLISVRFREEHRALPIYPLIALRKRSPFRSSKSYRRCREILTTQTPTRPRVASVNRIISQLYNKDTRVSLSAQINNQIFFLPRGNKL